MTYVFVGAVGFLMGLAAHDVAVQSLTDDAPLRPFVGVCTLCGHHRGWLKGRCQICGHRVSREPFVALVGAAVSMGFLHTVGFGWLLVPYLAFVFMSIALVVTDLEAFRIVDRLNIRGTIALGLLLLIASALTGDLDSYLRALGGAAAYFAGSSLLFITVGGRGFGAGDVKLGAQLGLFTAYLGWGVLGWAVFATAVIGGVVALFLVLAGGASRKTELPYGPPMILGSWVSIVMVGLGAIPIPS
ncbi:MAG: prepilin peptidase [Acidimicrobiia bacterium]